MAPLPALSTHADLARSLSNRQIQKLVRSKELTRLRRGYYLPTLEWTALASREQAALHVVAAASPLGGGATVSHTSAAVLHGLPTGQLQRDRLHVTWPGSAGRGATSSVVNHRSTLRDEDIVPLGGLRVTSVARTVYDIASGAEVRHAVAVADDALRRSLVDLDELTKCLAVNAGRPGSSRARQVIAFADQQSESVGESYARVLFRQLGLPSPELQARVVCPGDIGSVRVDFLFREFGTVVEFDGKVKYQQLLRRGESAADVVYREKCREDGIRATGLDVVRIVWSDLSKPRSVLDRCASAFTRQGHGGWHPSSPGLVGWPGRLC